MESVTFTSLTELRMGIERSYNVSTWTEAGICGRSATSICFTASATATVLVPGCRWIARTMDGLPSNQLKLRLSWTSSSTRATSCSRTGAPLR